VVADLAGVEWGHYGACRLASPCALPGAGVGH